MTASNERTIPTSTVLPSLARKDAWTRAAIQARDLIKLKLRHEWSGTQFQEAIKMTDNMLPMSDEQKAIWVAKAKHFEIFSFYVQTELGHGSNVRGIETTATFDKAKDEFIISSPTLRSTKYWIGTTGVWATHSVVIAKIIIDGEQFRNHLLLTQIRDLETQRLMPGCEIYKLGPKAFQGMLGPDNGAMKFHNVRMPRSHILARNAKKHSYGSMITVRALMAEITGWDLLKAVAVACRYTSYRKQFKKDNDQAEEITVLYYEIGAKVYSTEIIAHGIETCRIAWGGHGYHALSGFGRMCANAVNAVTYEGDNYVITQQKSDWFRVEVQCWALEQRLVHFLMLHIEDTEEGKDTSYTSHTPKMAHNDFVYWKGFSELLATFSQSQVSFLELIESIFQALLLSPPQQKALRSAHDMAVEKLASKPVVEIIEAYDFIEYEMDSALARADKTQYEALFEGAKLSEMSGNTMSHL
ncbi:MAG: hypothetical protein FE78DRAFT_110298 [Acidomyces sp. 'richmondensis']|nr:MAG: hypothetical protein FE78DRAFT_110298 [Acidomyces sp. 'richmondensis']